MLKKVSNFIKKNQTIAIGGSALVLVICAIVIIKFTIAPSSSAPSEEEVAAAMEMGMGMDTGTGGYSEGMEMGSEENMPFEPGATEYEGSIPPELSAPTPTTATGADFPSIPETKGSGVSFPHILLTTLSLIAGGFSVYSILQTRSWHQKQQRDARRKEDLETIRSALGAFHKKSGHYPDASEGEFIDFLQSLGRSLADPLEGKNSGYKDIEFGYRYDNTTEPHPKDYEAAERSVEHFRLWCLLENEHDPDIDHFFDDQFHWVYMLTSEGNARNLP